MNPQIISVQVGRSREFVDPNGRTWSSAIIKKPVSGEVQLTELSIVGDEQVDKKHHGGVDKAVLAYSADHFEGWKKEQETFAKLEILGGAFGENLTVSGISEADVCLGDRFRLGTSQIEVSQPRQPCWKLSKRWEIEKLVVEVQKSGRTGWYFRVLEPGKFQSGDSLLLQDRPFPEWTVARANRVMYAKPRVRENDLELAQCPALASAWRDQLNSRSRPKAQ